MTELPSKIQPAKCPPHASNTVLNRVLSRGSWVRQFNLLIRSFSLTAHLTFSLKSDLRFPVEISSESSRSKHFQREIVPPDWRRTYSFCLATSLSCPRVLVFETETSHSSSEPDMLDTSKSLDRDAQPCSSKSSSLMTFLPEI